MSSNQQILSSLGGAAPASFSDNFNNGTTIDPVWQVGPGVTASFTVAAGLAVGSASTSAGMVTIGTGRTFNGNHSATITLDTNINGGEAPCVRMQWTSGNDVGNCYYAYTTSTTIGVWKLYNNASFVQIGTNFTGLTNVAGDTITLVASGTGTVTFTVYRNGSSLGTRSDDGSGAGGAAFSGGQPGFLLNSAVAITNFSATDA